MKSEPFRGSREALLEACAGMEQRLRDLAGNEGDPALPIHELRKHGKRFAGALAISREAKPCIRWVRVIGSLLGGSRDATVRRETWANLLGDAQPMPGSIESVIGAVLRVQAEAAVRVPPVEVIDWSLAAVHQIRSRIENAAADELDQRCRKGAEQALRRLRKRLKQAARDAEDEDFHELRRVVKAWLGGMEILAPADPHPAAPSLHKLAERLGEEHDLDVFGDWLTENGFAPATAPRVWKRLPKLKSRARRRSLALIRSEVLGAMKSGGW